MPVKGTKKQTLNCGEQVDYKLVITSEVAAGGLGTQEGTCSEHPDCCMEGLNHCSYT